MTDERRAQALLGRLEGPGKAQADPPGAMTGQEEFIALCEAERGAAPAKPGCVTVPETASRAVH